MGGSEDVLAGGKKANSDQAAAEDFDHMITGEARELVMDTFRYIWR